MEITNRIVKENKITTMMITHNMKQALETGNRTIMLDSGSVMFDIDARQREELSVERLVEMYPRRKRKSLRRIACFYLCDLESRQVFANVNLNSKD